MDITTEAVRLGMDIAQLRMQIASANIAHANVAGAQVQRADFADALGALRDAAQGFETDPARLAAITPQTLQADVHSLSSLASDPVTLDDQVAELNVDSVTYRVLSEGLTRRFALMQLAISGK